MAGETVHELFSAIGANPVTEQIRAGLELIKRSPAGAAGLRWPVSNDRPVACTVSWLT
jgi:hypothetical protein